jgi:hypothetical protein
VSNDYAPTFPRLVWGSHTSIYDRKCWKEDDEWTWKC